MNLIAAATSSGLFLATIYNQSQLAERKHVARYWPINGCSINRAPLYVMNKLLLLKNSCQIRHNAYVLCTNHIVRFRSFLVYILYGFL